MSLTFSSIVNRKIFVSSLKGTEFYWINNRFIETLLQTLNVLNTLKPLYAVDMAGQIDEKRASFEVADSYDDETCSVTIPSSLQNGWELFPWYRRRSANQNNRSNGESQGPIAQHSSLGAEFGKEVASTHWTAHDWIASQFNFYYGPTQATSQVAPRYVSESTGLPSINWFDSNKKIVKYKINTIKSFTQERFFIVFILALNRS